MLLERGQDRFDVSGDVGREVIQARIINPARGVFQVKRVVAEPPQADEVMQELECDARQRIPERDSGNDDFAFGWFCAGHYITPAELTAIRACFRGADSRTSNRFNIHSSIASASSTRHFRGQIKPFK